MRNATTVSRWIDFAFRILSIHILFSGTIIAGVCACISTVISTIYESYGIAVATPAATFSFFISIIASGVASYECQTRFAMISTSHATIRSIEETLVQLTRSTNYNQCIQNSHQDPNYATIVSMYQQRMANIYIIRKTEVARNYAISRTTCVITILIYILFLQSRHSVAGDMYRTALNHFENTWPLTVFIMLIYNMNADSVEIAAKYSKYDGILQ